MNEYSPSDFITSPGFRLHRLEIFNWGTFDSREGHVHIVEPNGNTTLLVGRNGSGKSTLVDSLLTLIVPNQIRNYNVAAGAGKRERDEKSYIKGACGRKTREGGDDSAKADVKYLRPKASHYSALLAVFKNEASNAVFSIAQVLHIDAEGTADKVFCFRADEASIVKDLAGITSMERLRDQMERRGFVATKKYTEFQARLQKVLHFKSKAIDIFNQTVAVKDIESLNGFIRQHMLEHKPWRDKIDALLQHFSLLSEAHAELVDVRKQFHMLGPVKEKGLAYQAMDERHSAVRRRNDALDAFFRQQTVNLLEPEIKIQKEEWRRLSDRHRELTDLIKEMDGSIRRLENSIESAGGDRLKLLPVLIEKEKLLSKTKHDAAQKFADLLRRAGIQVPVLDESDFEALRLTLKAINEECEAAMQNLSAELTAMEVQQHQESERLKKESAELHELKQRKTNLPENHVYLRQRLCSDLHLSPNDLPFAAELMAVKPEEAQWEESIELVLRGLGLSLLVPTRLYRQVSDYIDQTSIKGSDGRGQRLVYLHVRDEKRTVRQTTPHHDSLLRKIQFREGHLLIPWLKAELAERFDYRCCATMEDFRQTQGLVLTKDRHFRTGAVRHEKDDRERAMARRNFVLGWDNTEKRKALQCEIDKLAQILSGREKQLIQKRENVGRCREKRSATDEALKIESFTSINHAPHDEQVAALEREKKQLEEGNKEIQELKKRLAHENAAREAVDRDKDTMLTGANTLDNQIKIAEKLVANAKKALARMESEGLLVVMSLVFPEIEADLGQELKTENLFDEEKRLTRSMAEAISRQESEIAPLRNALTDSMGRFVAAFSKKQHDLRATPDYLTSFLLLRDSIEREGLPKQEQRFKERLNEKVTQEIGLLNGALQSEQGEITSKIALLNESLRQLEYRRGTWIWLDARPMRDEEVLSFQRDMKECLSGSFEGTLEADEARYLRIEKLIARLKDEPRWTEKVTDVRRWFDFVAREIEEDSGVERDSYSDSGGKSGGEKAKLAFTILVAAIAYQYDITPGRTVSDRLHFVVVDEMFSKVDDQYSEYALELFKKFGLQLLIVAPLDAKARITEPYVGCYLHVLKDDKSNLSEVFSMTSEEFRELAVSTPEEKA